ncbi:MAG: DUF58 domain-containing protein [Deltaproteobacteria bacterium]|nr:DUF58 domain-containing protein [Deltaproteobacteria bacterium]
MDQPVAPPLFERQDCGVSSFFLVPPIQWLVAVLFFVALLFRHRDLAIVTLSVLAFGTGIKYWAKAGHRGLVCRASVDKERVFPGEAVAIELVAENRKLLPIWLHVEIPVTPPLAETPQGRVLAKGGSLLWHQRSRLRWEWTASRRGVYAFGPARLFASDLFEFLSRLRKGSERPEVVVYPKLVALKPLRLPRRDFFGVPGARSPVEDPVFILGTRDYQHGQPAKQIHWKATARHQRLQEKVLESTVHEKVLLAVDVGSFTEHGTAEDFEETLEAVGSLAARLDRSGLSVGLATNGGVSGGGPGSVPAARTTRQLSAILEVLARLSARPRAPLLEVLRSGAELTWGMSCVYFSCVLDDSAAAGHEHVLARGVPVTHFVCRPGLASPGSRAVRPLLDLRARGEDP